MQILHRTGKLVNCFPKEGIMLETHVAGNDEKNLVNDIVAINNKAFPVGWRYGEDKEYYREMIKSKDNLAILLQDGEKTVGFLLAIPHHNAVLELKDDDPLMSEDTSRYYIETIAILPEYRGRNGSSAMLKALGQELGKRGYVNISLHARAVFSAIVRNKLRATKIRPVKKWKYCGNRETIDYIEATFA